MWFGKKKRFLLFQQLDASIVSCALILVIVSIFLHINYMFKLFAMVLTAVVHMLLFGWILAKGVDQQDYLGRWETFSKVSFFVQCTKKRLITLQKFNIQTCFSQFLWFFSLRFWLKGQMISRIHLILPNVYKLMCFDRNINGNGDVKFLECDYFLVQRSVKLTLVV